MLPFHSSNPDIARIEMEARVLRGEFFRSIFLRIFTPSRKSAEVAAAATAGRVRQDPRPAGLISFT